MKLRVLYRHLHHHNDTIIKTDAGRPLLKKKLPLPLLQGFEKGYWRFACERELETEHLMAVNVVSFLFSRCSTGGPGVHSAGCWLSLLHLISNFSCSQTPSGFPRAPSAGCGFPYHISSIFVSNSSNWHLTSVLTELYNSSTPTRSPTWSLKSHV